MAGGPIKLAHLNIRGTRHKTNEFMQIIRANDIVFFTETWLGEEHNTPKHLLKGSNATSRVRTGMHYGGICYAVGANRDAHCVRIIYEKDGMILVVDAWGVRIC